MLTKALCASRCCRHRALDIEGGLMDLQDELANRMLYHTPCSEEQLDSASQSYAFHSVKIIAAYCHGGTCELTAEARAGPAGAEQAV